MKCKKSLCSLLALLTVITIERPSTVWGAISNCTISTVIPVAFGTYNVFAATALTVTGSIAVSCTGSGNAVVTLDKGQHSNSFASRAMQRTGGGDLLTYNLYTDASATTVWGDGTGGTTTQKLTGNNPSATLTVFGNAGAGQDVPAGSYTDTVVITVNF